MGYLAKRVAERVAILDAAPVPDNAICHHLGESFHVASLRVGLCLGNRADGKLLVTIYSRKVTVPGHCRHGNKQCGLTYVGYSEAIHRARANSVAHALGAKIVDQWNGGDGNCGISIVLDRQCPQLLLTGIRNYGRMRNPFELSDADRAGYDAYSAALSQNQ